MDYERAIQSINDINFLKSEENMGKLIQLINGVGQQFILQQYYEKIDGYLNNKSNRNTTSLKKEQINFVTKFLQIMCAQKDMRKKIFLDSLLESLKAIQLALRKGLKMDLKIIIMKIIAFTGENSFIDDGLFLSKYFYYFQKTPSVLYCEFQKSLNSIRWNLTNIEIDVAKSVQEPKDKEKNIFVLISRVKLLQKAVGGFSSFYEEMKANLQLIGALISEKETYYKEYVFLTHKMIVNAIKGNEKIDQNSISSFYVHHLNQENLSADQFGGMLVEILNLSRQNSFEKYIVHSIVVDCIQQISTKSRKSIYGQIFLNKIVVNMIEILCYQLDDPQLIEKLAHFLSEIPPNQKIKHISLLLKITSALREEKQLIEDALIQKKQKSNLQKFNLQYGQHMKEDSSTSSTTTTNNSYGSTNTTSIGSSSLFSASSSTVHANNKNGKNSKKYTKNRNKQRISNTPQDIKKQMEDTENSQKEEPNYDMENEIQTPSFGATPDCNQSYIEVSQFNFQQQNTLKKIKEEDQFYRLCEEYQELEVKDIGGIQVMMAYKIFNQIQDLKNIYFNNKLNYREILKELETSNKNVMSDSEIRRKKLLSEQIDQDLLNIFIIQNEICEIINEKEINRQEIRSQNLFYIFTFFLGMIDEQDNIYFAYKRSKMRGGSKGYQIFSLQFKQLVEDILKYHRHQNLDKIDSKSSKGRSVQTLPEYKQKIEELRNFQISYFMKASLALFRNNQDSDICYDLLESIIENLNCEDTELIHTLVLAYAQEDNVDPIKKLRIIADRSIELLLQMYSFTHDSQTILENNRQMSSVQKEARAASQLQKQTKTLEVICTVSLVYLNHGQLDTLHNMQDIKSSPIVKSLQQKLNEIKELYLKHDIETQHCFIQLFMETVCRFLFNRKRKKPQSKCLNIQGIFEEIGNLFVQLLKWNERDTLEQLSQLVQYMEFSDFCITQLQKEKNESGTEEFIEIQKYINTIRRMTIQNFEQFHAVDNLDVSDERAYNKVLIQILTKLTQILNTKFNFQSNLSYQQNFKTINLKLSLVNKIIYLILENRMKETSANTNLMSTQLIYEGGAYYNQILQILLEINEDIFSILQQNVNTNPSRNYSNWQVEHTHSFIVNCLLASDQIPGSPLLARFQQIQQNLSWREVKQLLHTLKYMREQAAYFKVGTLQLNLILMELLLLRFLKYEGQQLKSGNNFQQDKSYYQQIQLPNDDRITVCDEQEIKEEYYIKFIDLRIEESLEEYIQVLHQVQSYEEARKIFIYSQANSQIEDVQFWLKEIKRGSTGKGIKQAKLLEKYRTQLKCLIYEINVLRVENSQIIQTSNEQNYKSEQIGFVKKFHMRELMKIADKVENKIEKYERNSSSISSTQSALKLDYLVLSLRMHLICAKNIRQSNQSHLATSLIEKTFRKLTSLCFEKAYGNLNDIYTNQSLLMGASHKHHAAAKSSQEINDQQSQIGSTIDPFAKIQTLCNNRKYSPNTKVTGDLVEYLNIGNGFAYFKTTGSKKIQMLLLQSLKDYCKSQESQNGFNNLKYYGKLLQTASNRFLIFDELLRAQTLLKEYLDTLSCGVFIDVIGNILLQKQYNASSLHNLFSKRKSSVATMQLSSFIQNLHTKLLTQNNILQSSRFYRSSMKYMISLFKSTVRTNHRNLESEICEMIFFSKKKFTCMNSSMQQQQQQGQSPLANSNEETKNKKGKLLINKQKIKQEHENKSFKGMCDLIQNILSIDSQIKKQPPYVIVSNEFSSHIISHKAYNSFLLRYITLLQSLSLLSKVTSCRVSIAESLSSRQKDTISDDLFGHFIQLINFRELSKLLHNSFLSYNLIYAKQFFYLFHKFDETIKELLREIPSLLHVYKNNVVVKNCSCVCLNQTKAPLLINGEEQFLVESFSLDTSYMYKNLLMMSQGQSQQQDMIQEQQNVEENKMNRDSFDSQSSNYSSHQKESNGKELRFNSVQTKSNRMEKQLIRNELQLKENTPMHSNQQQPFLTQQDFEFKKLRTSMKDFSISKYNRCALTQNLEKSFKNSRINNFEFRKHSLSQLKLEHDVIIFNFIDYNNERAIQISKFNHLSQNYSSFRINSQSQTNLFADYLNDIKRILQNNESEMRDDEKKRKSQIDPNNWWKSRHSNDKQLQKILSQISTILDYHIVFKTLIQNKYFILKIQLFFIKQFLFFGSENEEREKKIIKYINDKINQSEEFSLSDSQSSEPSSSQTESKILIQEKQNLLEILFSLVKCSLFLKLNEIKYKLIFELICIQNIYLQFLGIQSQQYLFAEVYSTSYYFTLYLLSYIFKLQICKLKEDLIKSYDPLPKKPTMWILSENMQQVPIEFMSCFPDNHQSFYRIPSIQYLCDNYILNNKVNFANNYYLLNPSGDLVHTQSKFQQKFESIRSWEGASGFSVSSNELQKVLRNYESYTYIGHGAGELYLSQKQIQEVKSIKSAILLFGCQSARQVVQLDSNSNQYEATGNSLYFLMNKCKVLIGSLWDVTDRDTDRMVLKLIQIVEKASFKKSIDFTQAFLLTREECKLKWLNGSSFVCFGIPTEFYMK